MSSQKWLLITIIEVFIFPLTSMNNPSTFVSTRYISLHTSMYSMVTTCRRSLMSSPVFNNKYCCTLKHF